ncbi:MAG: radical SAM protein, partial [Promethearchaeota archaeon]
IQSIHLLGGEPFVRKDIIKIIKKITDSGIFCYISTNGTLIDQKIAEDLSLIENLSIDISLDGVCPNAHDTFRGVAGTFNKVINALEFLNENNVNINVTSVLGTHNISDIKELVELAVKNNAKRIQFLTFSTTGRGGQIDKELGFKVDDIPEIKKKCIELILSYLDKIYIDVPFMGLSPLSFRLYEILNFQGFNNYYDLLLGCNAGLTKMVIDASGKVMLCPQVRKGFGNLRNIEFIKAWQIINRYAKNNLLCSNKDCKYLPFCGGKCRIPNIE